MSDARYRQRPDGVVLEAVLHLLDGSSRADVARRYGLSEGYLSMVKGGRRHRAVLIEAKEIYRARTPRESFRAPRRNRK